MSKNNQTKQTIQLNSRKNSLRRSRSLERTKDTYGSRIILRRLNSESDYYCIINETTKSEQQNIADMKYNFIQPQVEILQNQVNALNKRFDNLEQSIQVLQNHVRDLMIANKQNSHGNLSDRD